MNRTFRMILIALMGLLLLGTGLCSALGLVIIVQDLRGPSGGYWTVAAMFTAMGLFVCWLSWFGIRALRRGGTPR